MLLNIDNTATGSVAEINVQNNKQTIKGICNQTSGNKQYKPKAIKTEDIINQKTAKEVIILQSFIISL